MSISKLTGLAVLANEHVIKGKTLLFDANFYVSSGETIVTALQYFNGDDHKFDPVAKYELRAHVACMPERIQMSDEIFLEDTEYDLVGDIIWLHCVNVNDPKQRPYLDVISVAQNVVWGDAEFDLTAEEYINPIGKASLPVCAVIPDLPKKDSSSSKPIPNKNSSIEVSGSLTCVIPHENDLEEHAEQFFIAVDSAAFLQRSSGSKSSNKSPMQIQTQKGKQKKVFDFNTNQVAGAISNTDEEDGASPDKKQKTPGKAKETEPADNSKVKQKVEHSTGTGSRKIDHGLQLVFDTYREESDYGEMALLDFYKAGLPKDLWKSVGQTWLKWKDFDEYRDRAMDLHLEWLNEREKEGCWKPSSTLRMNSGPSQGWTVASVNVLMTSGAQSSFTPLPKLTPEERDRLCKLGACFACGQPGHMSNECPTFLNNTPRLSISQNTSHNFPPCAVRKADTSTSTLSSSSSSSPPVTVAQMSSSSQNIIKDIPDMVNKVKGLGGEEKEQASVYLKDVVAKMMDF
ncbi:hypothetical protein D9758_005289 [Tetrapyrgos nigripes]|uniref:CCHC-type domain-containing protein n=1 Tax=Tetrapyrgos nigripes TaxID=182062 RepID=A0A8H5GX43_9AGAR|nr:hypothetical protein D9758_005289 [Tetrapyrgos nigripes]